MSDKEPTTERRVYVLPAELLARLRSFQTEQGIASEVEAARRLLDSALQMRDRAKDILFKLRDRYEEEKDLRILAREILANHSLITAIRYTDTTVYFEMRSGESGMIDADGGISINNEHSGPEYMNRLLYLSPAGRLKEQQEKSSRSRGGWEPTGSDLDDEIPF